MPSTIFFSCLLVIRVLAVFHPAADQLAGNSAEILVTGIGQKTSGIRQHADKVAEKPEVCQRGHLLCHSGLVVIEPPGASLLDLAHRVGILETSDDGSDRRVVNGIQGVEDRPGKLVGIRQLVEEIPPAAPPERWWKCCRIPCPAPAVQTASCRCLASHRNGAA